MPLSSNIGYYKSCVNVTPKFTLDAMADSPRMAATLLLQLGVEPLRRPGLRSRVHLATRSNSAVLLTDILSQPD